MGPVRLTDRDGTVEPHHRGVGASEQFVVPLHDLHPVGFIDRAGVGMERSDRRLCLIGAERVADECRLQQFDSFGDQLDIPATAVLLGERDQAAIRAGAGSTPGVVQQHRREQSAHLAVVGGGRQSSGESDGLGGEVDVTRVTLVEYQVQRGEHGAQIARLVEAEVGDGSLRAADPLPHGRFGNEVGSRDLPRGETTYCAEGEGHRRCRRQRRMGAQEVQLECVVGTLGRTPRGLCDEALLPPAPGGIGAG